MSTVGSLQLEVCVYTQVCVFPLCKDSSVLLKWSSGITIVS